MNVVFVYLLRKVNREAIFIRLSVISREMIISIDALCLIASEGAVPRPIRSCLVILNDLRLEHLLKHVFLLLLFLLLQLL